VNFQQSAHQAGVGVVVKVFSRGMLEHGGKCSAVSSVTILPPALEPDDSGI
jgi:hypothetical protein